MTNKEAIEILTNIKNTPQITWTNGADIAFDLAIKALENGRPQTIGCFNCKHNYKTVKAEACKYCNEKYSEWEDKGCGGGRG